MSFRKRRNNKQRRRRNNGLRKVKKDIKWLKQNIEFKFIDISIDVAIDTTGDVTSFNSLIAAGTGLDERVGEEVTARRIFIRGHVHNDRGTPADGLIRLIVFRQKRSLSVQTAVNEILDSGGSVTTNRMRNMDNKEDIVIYADHTIAFDTLAHTLVPFKFMFKLNHQAKYGGTATSAPVDNLVGFMAISTQATSANAPGVALEGRYSYVDS